MMSGWNCVVFGGYDTCTGIILYAAVLGMVVLIVGTDLFFALIDCTRDLTRPGNVPERPVRRFNVSLEEYFWSWTQHHPVSALVLCTVAGGAVSHFFWALKSG
jgi:hypothetical protein